MQETPCALCPNARQPAFESKNTRTLKLGRNDVISRSPLLRAQNHLRLYPTSDHKYNGVGFVEWRPRVLFSEPSVVGCSVVGKLTVRWPLCSRISALLFRVCLVIFGAVVRVVRLFRNCSKDQCRTCFLQRQSSRASLITQQLSTTLKQSQCHTQRQEVLTCSSALGSSSLLAWVASRSGWSSKLSRLAGCGCASTTSAAVAFACCASSCRDDVPQREGMVGAGIWDSRVLSSSSISASGLKPSGISGDGVTRTGVLGGSGRGMSAAVARRGGERGASVDWSKGEVRTDAN